MSFRERCLVVVRACPYCGRCWATVRCSASSCPGRRPHWATGLLHPPRALRLRGGWDERRGGGAARADAARRARGAVRRDARRPPLPPLGAAVERGAPHRRAARRRGGRRADASLGVLLVFATLFTVAHTAHRPAQAALTPQLARTPVELAAANVCWSTLEYVGFLAGSLAAGLIASLLPLDVGFAACAAALALTWLVLWPLPPDRRPLDRGGVAGPGLELLAGARTVWGHPEIRLLVVVYAVNSLAQGIIDVLVIIASLELLDLGAGGAGWLNAAWGVGGVAGGAASLILLGRGRLASGLSYRTRARRPQLPARRPLVVRAARVPAARGDGRRLRAGRRCAPDAPAAARRRRRPRARLRGRGDRSRSPCSRSARSSRRCWSRCSASTAR